MPFLVAIADLTHPLQNNRSSIGMIGCYLLIEVRYAVNIDLLITKMMGYVSKKKCTHHALRCMYLWKKRKTED